MAQMTKHVTVMHHSSHFPHGGLALFVQDPFDGDDESNREKIVISKQLYEDMGCPTRITVTVEPGDKLN